MTVFWSLGYLISFFFVAAIKRASVTILFSLSLSGFTGVAPAKKSPKLVSSRFSIFSSSLKHLSHFPLSSYVVHVSAFYCLTSSSSSPVSVGSCVDMVGLFVGIGMLCCVWGRFCVALHQCQGLGRGALMHTVSCSANRWMICHAGCEAC